MMAFVKLCLLAALVDVSAFRVRKGKKKVARTASSSVAATMPIANDVPTKSADPVAPVDPLAGVTAPEPVILLAKDASPVQAFLGPAPPTVAQGEPGVVDYIFTIGAPGLASPGLQNRRGSNSCFEGFRIYHSESGGIGGDWIDIVTRIGNLVYYAHAWYPSMDVDVDGYRRHDKPCNSVQTWMPDELKPSVSLHDKEAYIYSVGRVMNSSYFTNISIFAARKSYIHEVETVKDAVRAMGWGLVGSAIHPGANVYGGKQVSHLIQHPSTNECVLTFQGTASIQGWITNFHFPAAKFCGMTDEDEECSGWGTCTVRGKGSFVHEGLKHRLLSIIQTSDFQNNIRPNLGSCARVVTAGHSLGGAVAELFAGCASRAPRRGQFGYDDYKDMSWTKGAAAKLQFVH